MGNVITICFILRGAYSYFAPTGKPVGGGAERQLSLLANELKSQHDIHFLTADYGQPETVTVDGVTLHKLWDGDSKLRASETIRTVGALRSVRAKLSKVGPDATVVREKPWLTALSYGLTRGFDSRFVYNVANDADLEQRYDALPSYLRWLFARALIGADTVIAQTEYQRDVLQRRFGAKSTVVPNGYPIADSRTPSREREYFLWVGRIEPNQKRPDLFLDLAERVPSEKFVIIGPQNGPSEFYQEFTDRAASLENVEYVGAVDPDSVYRYYDRAIALINTSQYEGFPNTFLEAWRVGTPVVTCGVPLSRYTNDDMLVSLNSENIDALENTVRSLAADPEHLRTIANRSISFFERNYQIESVAGQYYNAIMENVQDTH